MQTQTVVRDHLTGHPFDSSHILRPSQICLCFMFLISTSRTKKNHSPVVNRNNVNIFKVELRSERIYYSPV